ncbi:LysR family transcriptional regulator [Salmonella enterica]|nr:LysR family transcriptional regulator [Salmonella enterica]EIV7305190.1 LysR family transcriptional regulator [Salmonella enterica subsp. enterica serovar Panama]EBG1336841.1 LysR family transcriptional regulator [Salmonella enterica]EBH0288927.1 LysR family transcriptional regulator [Salmonella enterica]ECD8519289.1 LysR family transcriptional regulator [Salmonella enterica]
MGKFEDMTLLVEVVEAGGLAAAGRRINLSPATMTTRLKALEERYQTRLFNRSTRAIALTRAGEEFYYAALRVMEEMVQAEAKLTQIEGTLSGTLRISAPSDFGRQYLSPALIDFSHLYPEVRSSVYLNESVVDLIANRLDMSVRVGNLPDSNLVTRFIRPNHRVLVASRSYLEKHGLPKHPEELHGHRCLVLELGGTMMNEWRFDTSSGPAIVRISPVMTSDNGSLLRQWALAGAGIISKSWWNVKCDVEQGRLIVLFADTFIGFSRYDKNQVGLQFVYPQRRFQPLPVVKFSEFFIEWMDNG